MTGLQGLDPFPNVYDASSRSQQRALVENALRQQYSEQWEDRDVRLYLLKRDRNAFKPRRKGDFPPDDALPAPATWAKLAPRFQQQICEWPT